ncbi:MAG: dihydroorotate dehydrogenase-like protein [Calditrichaeota bacterium]|nr:dihydroorotate dehydrogenase-like protein [Calditrichota bacterium]
MDLSTTYLGLTLRNPLVASSSPLTASLDQIRRLEDAGIAAVVLPSIFEEQITNEALLLHYHTTQGTDSFAEALTYFPDPGDYNLDGEEHVEHLRRVKETVAIPVIGSLNGVTPGGWTKYAARLQEAGADAIELNLYYIPTDPAQESTALEESYLDVVRAVREQISIPVALKLSPFFTSLPRMAVQFVEAGANGLVLFNRFYQPDLDIDEMRVKPHIVLSDSSAIRLPLRWIAILYGRIEASLAATGGVHTAVDAIKLLMAGASATLTCSALLKNGTAYASQIVADLQRWLEEHDYESVGQMIGSMSQKSVADPAAFERALYLKELQSLRI